MAEYHKLDLKQAVKAKQVTAEDRYWKQFKHPVQHKHFIKVTDLKFSPVAPHDFAACASTRVTVYDSVSLSPLRTITRFKDVSLSCAYRGDGRLLSSCSNDGLIQVFDVNSRMILRTLKGHTGSVWGVAHSTNFSWLFSSGDDKTVRKWDVSSESQLSLYQQHSDYVRIVQQAADNEHILISGSYDQSVKYWDTRLSTEEACIITLNHGSPVSAVCQYTRGAAPYTLITAGDVTMKAWDIRYLELKPTDNTQTTQPVHSLSNHQKTITSLSLDPSQTRVLSSSLDCFMKVTSVDSFSVVSSIKYSQPLLCAALSPTNAVLAAGMVDGTINIKQRQVSESNTLSVPVSKQIWFGSAAWFSRGSASVPVNEDYRVSSERKMRLKPYDSYLKKFQYHQALDAALRTNKAVIICSLLDELIDRQAILVAVSGRNEQTLAPLLNFLLQYLLHPYYSTLLIDVINVVLRVYSSLVGVSVVMDEWVEKISERVRAERGVQQMSLKMLGGLEIIWRGSEALSTYNQQQHEDTQPERQVEEIPQKEQQIDLVDQLSKTTRKKKQSQSHSSSVADVTLATDTTVHTRRKKRKIT